LRSLYRQHGFKEHNKAYRFFNSLDDYEEEYDVTEAKDFFNPRFTDPVASRNSYLNIWEIDYFIPWQQENVPSYWQMSG